jgi:ribosome-associated translation inhibitor RaiA
MKMPVDIRYIGLAPSPALEALIHSRIEHIDRFCPDTMAWRVTVEQEARHQQQGRPFAVRIAVTLPCQELAVNRVQHEDVYVALRDAFDAAKRQLEDAVRIRRGDVKTHAEPPARATPARGEEAA